MRVAVMFSGGKDSCYAVWLTLHQAWDVARLITVKPEARDSLMFHYPNTELTGLQAQSMGLQHTLVPCKTNELEQLEETLQKTKITDRLDGLVTGAIASDYQKSRFDHVSERVGLRSFSPLWHKKPEVIVENLIACGFKIIISSVAASGLDQSWLGKELTPATWGQLKEISKRSGLHLIGEGGEYETFVLNGPLFSKEIVILESVKTWGGQSGQLKVDRAILS